MISQLPAIRDRANRPAPNRNKGVTILRSLSELDGFREQWQALTTSESSPFQTVSWNSAWYRHFGDCRDEIVVFVAGNGSVVFPLYRKGRSLRFAGDDTCDYQDAIARNIDDVREGFPELINWAARKNLDLNFRKLSSEGFLYTVIREMGGSNLYFDPLERPVGPCPFFEIAETSEAYMARLPRKFRAELRRQMRRIAKDFPGTELRTRKSPEIDSQDIFDMVNFHRANFRCSGKNPIDDPRLRSLLLEIRDKPEVGFCVSRYGNRETGLAMDLTFVRGERFYGYLTAFDFEQARYSPGSCLLISRLDCLARQGVRIFDFLCGSESYKYRFASDEYSVRSARLVRRSVGGAFRYLGLRVAYSLRAHAKKVRSKIRALKSARP